MPHNAPHQRLRQAQLAEVRLHAIVMRFCELSRFHTRSVGLKRFLSVYSVNAIVSITCPFVAQII
jgi:hypothetical protein